MEKELFEKYTKLGKDNKSFDCSFLTKDKEGNYVGYDGAVRIILKNRFSELSRLSQYVSKDSDIVGKTISVEVDEIDEKNNFVYVTCKSMLKTMLYRKLYNDVKKKKETKCKGRIKAVTANYAIVDIEDIGLIGYIDASKWRKAAYTRNLKSVCAVGDVYDFTVVATNTNKRISASWELSRESLTTDPWEGFPTDLFAVGQPCVVKCIDIPNKKSYWWGKIVGIPDVDPDIEIMGDYTKKTKVAVGKQYTCNVVEIDTKSHIFKVVPFDGVDIKPDMNPKQSGNSGKKDKTVQPSIDIDDDTLTEIKGKEGKALKEDTISKCSDEIISELKAIGFPYDVNGLSVIKKEDDHGNKVIEFVLPFERMVVEKRENYKIALVNYYIPSIGTFVKSQYINRLYVNSVEDKREGVFYTDNAIVKNELDGRVATSRFLYLVQYKETEEFIKDPQNENNKLMLISEVRFFARIRHTYLVGAKVVDGGIQIQLLDNIDKNIKDVNVESNAEESNSIIPKDQNIETYLNRYVNECQQEGKSTEALELIEKYRTQLSDEKYQKLRFRVLGKVFYETKTTESRELLLECIDSLLQYANKTKNRMSLLFQKSLIHEKGGDKDKAVSACKSWMKLYEEYIISNPEEKEKMKPSFERVQKIVNNVNSEEERESEYFDVDSQNSDLDEFIYDELEKHKCINAGEAFSVLDNPSGLSENQVLQIREAISTILEAKTKEELWAIAKVYVNIKSISMEIFEENELNKLITTSLSSALYAEAKQVLEVQEKKERETRLVGDQHERKDIKGDSNKYRMRFSAIFYCLQAFSLMKNINSLSILLGSTCLAFSEFRECADKTYSMDIIFERANSEGKMGLLAKTLIMALYFNHDALQGFVDEFSKSSAAVEKALLRELSEVCMVECDDILGALEMGISKYANFYLAFSKLNWDGKISDAAVAHREFLNSRENIVWLENEILSLPQMRECFRTIEDYEIVKGFPAKAQKLQKTLENIQKYTEDSIQRNPTINSYYLILPCLYALREKLLYTYQQLCKTTKPLLTIDNDVEIEKEGNSFAFVVYVHSVMNNAQDARNVYLRIKDKKNIECAHEILVAQNIPSDGRKIQTSIPFKLVGEMKSTMSIQIGLRYDYISDVKIERIQHSYTSFKGRPKKRSYFKGQDIEKTVFWPGQTNSEWMNVDVLLDSDNSKRELTSDRINKFSDDGRVDLSDSGLRKILKNRNDQVFSAIDALTVMEGEQRKFSKKGRWVIIYGQWRVGKSVILNCIENELLNEEKYPDAVVLKLDCSGSDKENFEDEFATSIYGELRQKMRRSQYRTVFESIRDYYAIPVADPKVSWMTFSSFMADFIQDIREIKEDAAVVLLVDEFTEIYQAIIKGHAGERFPARWAELISRTNILCVTAGGEHTVSLMDTYTPNTLQKAEQKIYVQYLTKQNVDEYVHYIFGESSEDEISKEDSYFAPSSDLAVSRIFELTKGNAYLLKNFCSWIIEYINEKKRPFLTVNVVNATLDYIMQKEGMDVESLETIYFNSLYNPFNETKEGVSSYENVKRIEDDEVKEENLMILHRIVMLADRDTHVCAYEELRDVLLAYMDEVVFNKRFNTLKTRKIIEIDKNENVSIFIDLYYEIVSRMLEVAR